jgi:hypothetical protein
MKYLLFFLLFCPALFAQVTDGTKDTINIAKDTIELKQIVIREDFRRFEDSKVKIKGNCLSPESLNTYTEVVTLADNLPQGYLESVTFFFNERHYTSYNSDRKNFKDTEFEVVLYKVNPDNTPGERIMRDEKYILVMNDHTGEAEVHFLEFNIKNQQKMFIGLRRTEPGRANERNFYVDCICNNSGNVTYSRSEQQPQWARQANCPALRMEINFLVSQE